MSHHITQPSTCHIICIHKTNAFRLREHGRQIAFYSHHAASQSPLQDIKSVLQAHMNAKAQLTCPFHQVSVTTKLSLLPLTLQQVNIEMHSSGGILHLNNLGSGFS